MALQPVKSYQLILTSDIHVPAGGPEIRFVATVNVTYGEGEQNKSLTRNNDGEWFAAICAVLNMPGPLKFDPDVGTFVKGPVYI